MGFWQYLKWSSIYILSIVIGSACATLVWRDWAAVMNFDFLVWDAEVLYRMVKDGYDYYTAAFYPMFPWLWKWLAVSPWLISLLNGSCFLIVVSFIGVSQKMSKTSFLLHQ